MPDYRLQPLPYHADGAHWLARLEHWPHRVWLDSARPWSRRGEWDLLSADPVECWSEADDHPDAWLSTCRQVLAEHARPRPSELAALPFVGGLIGILPYPLGERLHGLPRPGGARGWAGFYDWAVVSNHRLRQSWLVAHPRCEPRRWQRLQRQLATPPEHAPPPFRLTRSWSSNLDADAYGQAFAQVRQSLARGDCDQVNLARRFSSRFEGDPLQAYGRLRQVAAAPYSAYLELAEATLLCLSPERFLRLQQDRLLTEPIKGTAARHPDPARDAALAAALQASAKDDAENRMIVEVLRQDLARVAEPGSVAVGELLQLQSFATVHHLVSTVEARLAGDEEALTALAACFPGGSITGAPRSAAMALIHRLEPHHRDYYCGSLFYSDGPDRLDSNITIRSLVCRGEELHAWAGGGIVAASRPEEEYQETEVKIRPLLDALAGP